MLNGIKNVEVRKVRVGPRHETRRMVVSPLMPGGASVDGKTVEEICAAGVSAVVEEISIVTLDEEIPQASLPAPDFIKIDIEGWGIEALRGARNTLELHKPTLFLEMHGETLREKRRKSAEIVACGRSTTGRSRGVETGSTDTLRTLTAIEGHLYCRGGNAPRRIYAIGCQESKADPGVLKSRHSGGSFCRPFSLNPLGRISATCRLQE